MIISFGTKETEKIWNGKLNEFHSIRINDQWRIIFIWKNNNSHNVTILDYHK